MTAQRHFLGLRHAALLRTPYWALGRSAIDDATERSAIASLTGPPGTGKTFLLDTAEPELPVRVVRVEPHLQPTMLSITIQLLEAITGDQGRGSRHERITPLVKALRGPLVVMIDEAQRMNRECLDHLRFLHDHRDTRFALILAGGEGCWEVLGREPQLRRRIWRPTAFKPLGPDHVRTLMPKFHPAWDTEPAVLDTLDAEFAQGLLGNWAALTATAEHCRDKPTDPVQLDEVPTLLVRHGTRAA